MKLPWIIVKLCYAISKIVLCYYMIIARIRTKKLEKWLRSKTKAKDLYMHINQVSKCFNYPEKKIIEYIRPLLKKFKYRKDIKLVKEMIIDKISKIKGEKMVLGRNLADLLEDVEFKCKICGKIITGFHFGGICEECAKEEK